MGKAGVLGAVKNEIGDAILPDVPQPLEVRRVDQVIDELTEGRLGPLDVAMNGISEDPRPTVEGTMHITNQRRLGGLRQGGGFAG